MNVEQAIKKRLSDLCQERHITLSDLGAISKVDPSITTGIESGTIESTPFQAIVQYCHALGVQLPDFFCNEIFRNLER